MNPNPLLALNHFTVPCSLIDLFPSLLFKLFVLLDRLQGVKLQVGPAPLIKSKGSQERQTQDDCNMPASVRSALTIAERTCPVIRLLFFSFARRYGFV